MKYIILEADVLSGDSPTVEIPIIFPDIISHSDIAEQVKRLLLHEHEMHSDAVSAGFVNHNVECHGKSETLNLKSRPEDSGIINFHNYTGGIKDARESLSDNKALMDAMNRRQDGES